MRRWKRDENKGINIFHIHCSKLSFTIKIIEKKIKQFKMRKKEETD